MAEWCQNYPTFTNGDVEGIIACFRQMGVAEDNHKDHDGQNPPGLECEDAFHYISVDEENTVNYQTKYRPNINDLVKVADLYGCDFELRYWEQYYEEEGWYRYHNKKLDHIYMEEDDYALIKEDDDLYCYDGEEEEFCSDSEEEVVDYILEKKIANFLLTNP